MSPFVKDVLLALVIGICATLLGLMGVRYFILPGLLVVDAFTPLNIRTATDVPLSAVIVNLLESGIYLWFGMTVLAPGSMSLIVAWSKRLGTGMVTVFVFLQYPDHTFVQVLAVLVGLIDAAYLALMYARRRGLGQLQG